jgi:hypothetical protein
MPGLVSFRFLENEETGWDAAPKENAEFIPADEDGLLQTAGY